MMFCSHCNVLMVKGTSFSKNKRERFAQCPKCKSILKKNSSSFGEYLTVELEKQRGDKR
nr:MAG TPA: DNA-directed RNA polymerase II subunit [Caudoviricetes sp.]